MNMADEDGWVGVTWNGASQYDRNFALAGYDRTHVFQMASSTSCLQVEGRERRGATT